MYPIQEAPILVGAIERARIGKVIPIRIVGGSRQIAATIPRKRTFTNPWLAVLTYIEPMRGSPKRISRPKMPIPNSIAPYSDSGRRFAEIILGPAMLPRHNPAMYVDRSNPRETADEP